MKALTGYEMPCETLMYIWENRAPVGTVIANQHTSRVKMIVAESGKVQLGEWREEVRNVYEDYKRAFGEEPPSDPLRRHHDRHRQHRGKGARLLR